MDGDAALEIGRSTSTVTSARARATRGIEHCEIEVTEGMAAGESSIALSRRRRRRRWYRLLERRERRTTETVGTRKVRLAAWSISYILRTYSVRRLFTCGKEGGVHRRRTELSPGLRGI